MIHLPVWCNYFQSKINRTITVCFFYFRGSPAMIQNPNVDGKETYLGLVSTLHLL